MSSPIDRLHADPGARTASELLATDLPGADLRSLLLHVAERRAARPPASVLAQFTNDRFCAPAPIDGLTIARAHAASLGAVADEFDPIQLAPLAPLATSAAMSAVPQNNVVTTMRLSDVVSDPTNVLALEAALRRRSERDTVRLAAAHRVVRAQRFDGPRSFAHFSLLGLVSAGRDRGDRAFEIDELVRHLGALARAIRSVRPDADIVVSVSDHSGRLAEAEAVIDRLDVESRFDPERSHGRGYYEHLCCKIGLRIDGDIVEVGDGGSTDWTQHLSSNRKERLVISGLGLDRIVM